MSLSFVFWLLMLLWIIAWFGNRFGGWAGPFVYASEFFVFCLFFLLGWHDFGFIIHQ
jgi:hypothetical protein